ncbi:hypothetical protein IGI49_001302 [Enterococcus sp. AZ071]
MLNSFYIFYYDLYSLYSLFVSYQFYLPRKTANKPIIFGVMIGFSIDL